MNPCPFCGKEYHALKNHVRLASGNGHGPSGQYPKEFESGWNERDKDTVEGTDISGPIDAQRDTDITQVSPPSNDRSEETEVAPVDDEEPLTAVERGIYEVDCDGAINEPSPLEIKSATPATEPTTGQSHAHTCPECGGWLETGVEGIRYIRNDGALLELEESDAVCNSCDLVVPDTGVIVYGSDYGSRKNTEDGWNTIALVVFSGFVAFLLGVVSKLRENDGDKRAF
jgi:hypothetical protein